MASKLLIHAGLPKCGSTALQFVLASNRHRLREESVHYPVVKKNSLSHMRLCGDLRDASRDRRTSAVLKRVVSEFGTSGADTLLLSSEGFALRSRWYEEVAFGDLIDQFDTHVVVFIRRRDEWTRSFYKNRVKSGDGGFAGTFSDFAFSSGAAEKRLKSGKIADAVERFARLFKAGKVEIVALDNQPDGTPALMGQRLGIPLQTLPGDSKLLNARKAMEHENNLPINRALSDVHAMFYAACNTMERDAKWHRAIRRALNESDIADVAPDVRLMAPGVAQRLLDDGKADDLRFAALYGTPVQEYAPKVDAHVEYRERLTEEEFTRIRDRLVRHLSDDEYYSDIARMLPPARMLHT